VFLVFYDIIILNRNSVHNRIKPYWLVMFNFWPINIMVGTFVLKSTNVVFRPFFSFVI